jgi:hypothetical protein
MPKCGKVYALILSLLPVCGLLLSLDFAGRAAAADIEELPAAHWRLSQNSSQACAERCIATCRAAKADCSASKDGDACRAQFQICARRCVVTCSTR